jgi:hypothetical protein
MQQETNGAVTALQGISDTIGKINEISARPHTMNVGQALRALGWRRQRIYARGGGGCRYWVPPLDGAA